MCRCCERTCTLHVRELQCKDKIAAAVRRYNLVDHSYLHDFTDEIVYNSGENLGSPSHVWTEHRQTEG